MMTLRPVLIISFLLIGTLSKAQIQPGAKVVILFKDTVNVTLHVNFDRANPELVAATQLNEDGTQLELKINTGVIRSFFLNDHWYKFKDLNNGYNDSETVRNACVKLIIGKDSLGLFEFKDEQKKSSYYIQTPKDDNRIYNIEHPYVAGDLKSFSLLRFIKCAELADKIRKKESGYYYEENGSTQAEKLAVWKNIIITYYYYCSK